IIREPQHPVATKLEPFRPLLIVSRGFRLIVLRSIQFDRQPSFAAFEIDNIPADRRLTPKRQTFLSQRTQTKPETHRSVCQVLPQFSTKSSAIVGVMSPSVIALSRADSSPSRGSTALLNPAS